MRKVVVRHFVLPASFLLASCGEADTDPGSDPTPAPQLADESQFRSGGWEDFPIVLDGVILDDIDGSPYEFEIEPNVFIQPEDFADVVTRWTSFQPCDGGSTPLADAKKSFFWGSTTAGEVYVEAAGDRGLHVILPLPFIGLTNPNAGCGIPDLVADPDELWDNGDSIRIPLAIPTYGAAKDLITTDFTNYWAAKAALYVEFVDGWDTTDIVWRWRVIEELRYWEPFEYEFALAVRDTVTTNDGTRPMTEYTAGHYLPHDPILYTLVEQGTTNSSNPETFNLDPADPVARLANSGSVTDLYDVDVDIERDTADHLKPLFDDVLTGAYTGHIIGSHALHNRIHPYHRIRLGREALDNLEYVYSTNAAAESISQDPPDHILFHAPDLTLLGPDVGLMTAEHGRHDLWAGVHEAKGIWIYSMAYRDESSNHEDVWAEYVRALYLIKSEMRPYLTDGVKSTPTLTHNGTQTVPSDYYVDIGPFANSHMLALPDAPDEYSTINHTLFRVDDVGYLIVTNSWNEEADIEVEFADCIDTATIVSGSSALLATSGQILEDTFDGIDGRVYKITFESCP